MKAKPFIKWVGGKGQLIKQLDALLPADFNQWEDVTYIEPFIGGGAMLFYMLQTYPNIKSAIINDINEDLTTCYKVVRDSPSQLIEALSDIQEKYINLQTEEEQKQFYLAKRDEYNTKALDSIRNTTLFFFLNRTCFNGLYRVNKSGLFNVPFGRYRTPTICDSKTIYADSEILQKVEIMTGDYELTLRKANNKTLIYLDPPYRPLSTTSYFNEYATNTFDDKEQERLKLFCDKIALAGHSFMLSNSDCFNTQSRDRFFEDLFLNYTIERVWASRSVNANPTKRGKLQEIVIHNYRQTILNNDLNIVKMKKGGTGGGNTKTGLIYEGKVDLATFLNKQKDYSVVGIDVYYKGELVALTFKKHQFYTFLEKNGVHWEDYISCRLLPDNCIYVIINNTLFIIEVKSQVTAGSVDEKLQTCDFKKRQYQKLLSKLNIEVEYVYILSDWFRNKRYKDVLDYIHSVRCQYYFNYIPLHKLGLPVPEE